MSAWSHLPNAASIDDISEDQKQRPLAWDIAEMECWNAARSEALGAARDAAWVAGLSAGRAAALDESLSAACLSAWDAVAALIAWDHAGSYLDMPRDQVRTLAALGDQIAILLLPAVIMFEYQRKFGVGFG